MREVQLSNTCYCRVNNLAEPRLQVLQAKRTQECSSFTLLAKQIHINLLARCLLLRQEVRTWRSAGLGKPWTGKPWTGPYAGSCWMYS